MKWIKKFNEAVEIKIMNNDLTSDIEILKEILQDLDDDEYNISINNTFHNSAKEHQKSKIIISIWKKGSEIKYIDISDYVKQCYDYMMSQGFQMYFASFWNDSMETHHLATKWSPNFTSWEIMQAHLTHLCDLQKQVSAQIFNSLLASKI